MSVTASRIPSKGRSDEQTSYVFNFNLWNEIVLQNSFIEIPENWLYHV